MSKTYDIAIIGLGPAGLKALKCALKNNLSVIAFEKQKTGGTCLNLGCIPTKAIMHSAELYKDILNAGKAGIIGVLNPKINLLEILKRKDNIVEKLSTAVKNDLLAKGAVIIESEAKLVEKNNGFTIIANSPATGLNTEYLAKDIIIATGSAPYELKELEFNHKTILSSDDILKISKLPKNITIVGSGAIGIEWSRIMSSLNVDVTIVEKEPNLLPAADIDVQKRILRMCKMSKIKVFTNCMLTSFKDGIAELSGGQKYNCESILVAAGRKRVYPDVIFINKNATFVVNSDYTTNLKNVFAIGDIQANKMLAHNASSCAARLMDKLMLGKCNLISDNEVPTVVYGNPEIASIGLREKDLPKKFKENPDYKIYNISVAYLPKAWCDSNIEGFVKIITHKNKIIGAHIVSKEASALIMQVAIAMKANMDIETLKSIVFAHPSYSEGILEALENG